MENNEQDNESKNEPVSILLDEEKGKINELVDSEVLTNNIRLLLGAFILLSFVIIFQAGYTIVKMSKDKSIPRVVCPQTYDLDSPVVMNTIDRSGPLAVDRMIRGFLRRYVGFQFPRKGDEAKTFYTYVKNHSTGAVQYKYEELLDDVTQIKGFIDSGFYYQFYPTSSENIRIRPITATKWAVEIDGYLIKRMGGKEERYTPTLKYVIEDGEANLLNPEGLYVTEASLEQITDYVSGKTKEL